jgi:hypothetical protein
MIRPIIMITTLYYYFYSFITMTLMIRLIKCIYVSLFYCELNKFRSTFKIPETNFSNISNLSISHARMLIHFLSNRTLFAFFYSL